MDKKGEERKGGEEIAEDVTPEWKEDDMEGEGERKKKKDGERESGNKRER